MPIVASQHKWKDSDHRPLDTWPEDCHVQWGGRGVVLSDKPGGSYNTAFFEAFPKAGGFIRGEGPTIAEAEAKAFEQYQRSAACDHLWSRGKYTNGGAICRRCKGFQSVFEPIVRLGGFREPLNPSSLNLIAEGYIRPRAGDTKQSNYARRTWLKARVMGIDLPDFDSAPPAPMGFEEDDYARACRKAVVSFLRENLDLLEGERPGGLEGLFSSRHLISLKRVLEMHKEEDEAQPTP